MEIYKRFQRILTRLRPTKDFLVVLRVVEMFSNTSIYCNVASWHMHSTAGHLLAPASLHNIPVAGLCIITQEPALCLVCLNALVQNCVKPGHKNFIDARFVFFYYNYIFRSIDFVKEHEIHN